MPDTKAGTAKPSKRPERNVLKWWVRWSDPPRRRWTAFFLSPWAIKRGSDTNIKWTKIGMPLTKMSGVKFFDFLQQVLDCRRRCKSIRFDLFDSISLLSRYLERKFWSLSRQQPINVYNLTLAIFSNFLRAFLNPIMLRVWPTPMSISKGNRQLCAYPVII